MYSGACPREHKGIYTPKFDLIVGEEYVANLVNVDVVVNVQQCSLLDGYAIPA